MTKKNIIIVSIIIVCLLALCLGLFCPRNLKPVFETNENIVSIRMQVTIDHNKTYIYTLNSEYNNDFVDILKQTHYIPGYTIGQYKGSINCDMTDDLGNLQPTTYDYKNVIFYINYEHHTVNCSDHQCSIYFADGSQKIIEIIKIINKRYGELEQMFYR